MNLLILIFILLGVIVIILFQIPSNKEQVKGLGETHDHSIKPFEFNETLQKKYNLLRIEIGGASKNYYGCFKFKGVYNGKTFYISNDFGDLAHSNQIVIYTNDKDSYYATCSQNAFDGGDPEHTEGTIKEVVNNK